MKQNRVMGQNELRTGIDSRLHHLLRRIQCHIYLRDLPIAPAHQESGIVPVTGSLPGRQGLQLPDDFSQNHAYTSMAAQQSS